MNEPVVAVEGLVKHYGDVVAVDSISFQVHEGEIFGLLGTNGAGKTTTINVLCTYTEPTAGEVAIVGHSVTAEPEAVKRAIGVVPQDIALYPDLNAVENLRFFGRMYDVPKARLEQRMGELLELVGLSEHTRKRVEHYSGGMKRRLNLAVGLLSEPSFLMLDEPTVGVDPQSRNAIFENIQALNRQGLSILYTTHYMEEAELLCHRVAIMDEGRIIALDTPQNLINTLGAGLIHIQWSLLGGKLLAQFLMGVGQIALMFIFGAFVFHVQLGNSLLGLLLITLATCWATTSLGILLVSVIRSRKQIHPITTLIILGSSAIGGSWFPLFMMPKAVQQVARVTLVAWAMEGYNRLMMLGGSLADVWVDIGVLVIYGAVCFGVGLKLFRFKEA